MSVKNINFLFEVGGKDKSSSSTILKDWDFLKEEEFGENSIIFITIKI